MNDLLINCIPKNKVVTRLPLPPVPKRKNSENLYWISYHSLEEEYLTSLRYVLFNSDQLNVYSPFYLDLLCRIWVEIEALSKRLYLIAGGTKDIDDGKTYFDSVCLDYLNEKWHLAKKGIWTQYPNSGHWAELFPLKDCHIKGKEGAPWKSAYQAIKHNKEENVQLATLQNCLFSLGALYILNIMYRDEQFSFTYESGPITIDWSFGSKLFECTYFEFSNKVEDESLYAIALAEGFIKQWNDAADQGLETFSNLVEADPRFKKHCSENANELKPFENLSALMSLLGKNVVEGYLIQSFTPYFQSLKATQRTYNAYLPTRHHHDETGIDIIRWFDKDGSDN